MNAQDVKNAKNESFLGNIPAFLLNITNYSVLILGIWFVMNGEFTLGALQMFQGLMCSFLSPAMTLVRAGQTIQEMRSQMERIEDVMEYPSDENLIGPEVNDTDDVFKLSGNIELKNVTFGYSKLTQPLISDFSMKLKAGGKIAFVGSSGCGKSTIAKLICGLYSPWEGEILFDGKHRKEIPHEVMTGSIAVVDQDITLYEGTFEENIKMWDDSVKDFEVILAARDAQIHNDIMSRPGGYHYKIASGGRDLSGGQRQRLEITLISNIVLYYIAAQKHIDQSSYYAFTAAYGVVAGAFQTLSGTALSIGRIKPVMELAEPFLETVPESSDNRELVTSLSGKIELNNVCFRYSEDSPYIIQNLSLKIRAGEYVAIVGQSGCGKSTLIRLLLGFETPEKGAVYYDGKDLNKLEMSSLRKEIGIVLQESGLFRGDLFSNITISDPTLSLDDAWDAAEKAGIADDIRAMPMGMHTYISEGQGGISGGQRQRIMIARAIAPHPKILIFDEATSALDNTTQKKSAKHLTAFIARASSLRTGFQQYSTANGFLYWKTAGSRRKEAMRSLCRRAESLRNW